MTPKEKAVKLFNAMQALYDMKQYPEFIIDENDNQKNDELWQNNKELFRKIYKEFAKQSTLIAVDEILKSNEDWDLEQNIWCDTGFFGDCQMYWIAVKQEIEKL